MQDGINEKIINIFDKHNKTKHVSNEEEMVYTSPDGFKYVHIKHDENGHLLHEDKILERADQQCYIVRVLEHQKGLATIKSFQVSGERLLEFLEYFINKKRPGKIIEIDKYYPQNPA